MTSADKRADAGAGVLHPAGVADAALAERLSVLQDAVAARRKLRIAYVGLDGTRSEPVLRPLGVTQWDRVWTLAAWSESDGGLRNYRISGVASVEALDEHFEDEPGKTFDDVRRLSAFEAAARDGAIDA